MKASFTPQSLYCRTVRNNLGAGCALISHKIHVFQQGGRGRRDQPQHRSRSTTSSSRPQRTTQAQVENSIKEWLPRLRYYYCITTQQFDTKTHPKNHTNAQTAAGNFFAGHSKRRGRRAHVLDSRTATGQIGGGDQQHTKNKHQLRWNRPRIPKTERSSLEKLKVRPRLRMHVLARL